MYTFLISGYGVWPQNKGKRSAGKSYPHLYTLCQFEIEFLGISGSVDM